MNLLSYVNSKGNVINGKKLTQPQLNLLGKLDAMGVTITDAPVTLRNPISGYTVPVADPLLAVLVNWVYEVYASYDFGPMTYRGTKVAIGTFDRTKMLVLSLFPNGYSNFID